MKKNNWVVWFDNKPEYKEGDIVLYYVTSIKKVAGIITKISIKPYSNNQKKLQEESIEKRKNCCGRDGRGIRTNMNSICYFIGDVKAEGIIGGIDEINKELESLNEQCDRYSDRIQKVAVELGFSNDY